MEVRFDPFESAKSHFFDTSSWGPFCDVTLTLKQAHQSESGMWVKIDDYPCRQAFRHFMNLLNRAVYGAAFRRYGTPQTDLRHISNSGMPKRTLENGERRLALQSHQSRAESPEFASQRLGHASITRGNVGSSRTA